MAARSSATKRRSTRPSATARPATPVREFSQRVSDDAVRAKTGRGWTEWFRLLDAAGAKRMTHREIVALAGERYGAGPWWRQMVTVSYEQSRGLRDVHQVASGYTAGVSRTMAAPCGALAAAFENARVRASWLRSTRFTVRSGMKGRVMRFDGPAGTRVEASFTARGADRSTVTVEHTRLAGAAAVAKSKALWRAALDRLQARLET
jgi:hypothetical protein